MVFTACNHPSLITGNLQDGGEAIEPRASTKKDESTEEVDELASALGGLDMSTGKKCHMFSTKTSTVQFNLCYNSAAINVELSTHTVLFMSYGLRDILR